MSDTSTWFDDLDYQQIKKLGKQINRQDFDHVFQVTAQGVQDGPGDVYAPDVLNDDEGDVTYEDERWTALTGYTGQYGYCGAVMHASEFIGGHLAYDIIEMSAQAEAEGRPLLWTVTTAEVLDPEDEEAEPAGWVVLYRET